MMRTHTRLPRFNASLLLFLSCLAFSSIAANNAGKVSYPFADGDTIPLQLSSININRLMVKNDRIINLVCPRGFCTTSANQKDKTGSITLKINIALPFTAHITTDRGRIFALFVTPKKTPALVTEFVSTNQHLEQKSVFEQDFDYPESLTKFTAAMMQWQHNPSPIPGFKTHRVDPKTLPKDKSVLPVIPTVVFVGKDYSGIIYQVVNKSTKPITLTTAQFYSYSARSAALDDYALQPGAHTMLYIVTGGGI